MSEYDEDWDEGDLTLQWQSAPRKRPGDLHLDPEPDSRLDATQSADVESRRPSAMPMPRRPSSWSQPANRSMRLVTADSTTGAAAGSAGGSIADADPDVITIDQLEDQIC